ncbi:hypothetical protein MKW94_011818 [Papaver nudicaule]|uniref:Uncharacterized protein n=1 Tax=Papaver nudicaule TaxID=74823 RepID=A0AA41UXQ4_PAPNU|nr:hypothetical protein [Papaver nudicaule]
MAGKINVVVMLMCFMVLAVAVQFSQAHGDDGPFTYKTCFMTCFDLFKAKGLGNSLSEMKCDGMCSIAEKFGKYDEVLKNMKL